MKHAHIAMFRWLVALCLACAALLAGAPAKAAILGGPPQTIRIEVDDLGSVRKPPRAEEKFDGDPGGGGHIVLKPR